MEEKDRELLNVLSDMDLSEANTLFSPYTNGPKTDRMGDVSLADGTYISWDGFRGNVKYGPCHFDVIWNQLLKKRPNIIVANFGLHLLHLYAGGREPPVCFMQLWLNYESWLDEAVAIAEEVGAKLLLFKTTNLMCTEKFVDQYAISAPLFEQGDSATLNKCYYQVQQLINQDRSGNAKSFNVTVDKIKEYCRHGAFINHGVTYLNDRLFQHVKELQHHSSPNLTIAIYNDHDVESCNYTSIPDGRHYHPLNLVRIRLLANMIQCLWKDG